jgi:6-phosphogluconolactonase
MAGRAFVYVSCAEDGTIAVYALDTARGILKPVERVEAGKNVMPVVAHPDGRHLYAIVRLEPFRVVSFAIDRTSGQLTRAGEALLPDSMAYASTDRSGRWLLTASYGGSRAAVSPIAASGVVEGEAAQVVATGQHAHCIVTDRSNALAFVPCLGGDELRVFKLDPASGALVPSSSVAFPKGTGPRHAAVSPDNGFAYVLGELTGTVTQLAIDPAGGALKPVDIVASVPEEAKLIPGKPRGGTPHPDVARMIWCADIAITPDGRHIYTTERTGSRLAHFDIDAASGTPHTEIFPVGV